MGEDLRKQLVGKALDPNRLRRGSEVAGDMHLIRDMRRVGSGEGGALTVEDKGRSGHRRGTPVREAWCGINAAASRQGGVKMTYNQDIVTCGECLEAIVRAVNLLLVKESTTIDVEFPKNFGEGY